jgi:hypothetical protein
MKKRTILALALLASACGGGNQAVPSPTGHHTSGTNEAARLASLSTGQRNAVFIRAIRDAGLECQHVDWSEQTDTYRGMPVWIASCSHNQVWAIVVGENGVAQILNPTEARIVFERIGQSNQAAGR